MVFVDLTIVISATTLQQTKPLKSTRHEIQHLKVLIIMAIALVLHILGAIIILFTYWTCTWVSRSRLCPVLPSSQPPALRKQSDIDDSGWVLIHGTAFCQCLNKLLFDILLRILNFQSGK